MHDMAQMAAIATTFLICLITACFSKVYAQDIQAVQTGDWSDPKTWSSGTIPTVAATVTIGSAFTVTLSKMVSAVIKDIITIHGVLICEPCATTDVSIQSHIIAVDRGQFICGEEHLPFKGKFKVQFTSAPPAPKAAPALSTGLSVLAGGQLILHGKPVKSWTQLRATAPAKAATVTVDLSSVGPLKVKDKVIITSTDFEWNRTEYRKVAQLQGTDQVRLDQPLTYSHYGVNDKYSHPTMGTVGIGAQAEFAILNRNIVFDGQNLGHCIIMPKGFAQVAYVELYRMGVEGALGKYPFHWHVVGDGTGGCPCKAVVDVSRSMTICHLAVHCSYCSAVVDSAHNHTLALQECSSPKQFRLSQAIAPDMSLDMFAMTMLNLQLCLQVSTSKVPASGRARTAAYPFIAPTTCWWTTTSAGMCWDMVSSWRMVLRLAMSSATTWWSAAGWRLGISSCQTEL